MQSGVKEDKSQAGTADIPKFDSEEYVLRKRLPRRLPKRPNDVYISRKTDFRAQLARQDETVRGKRSGGKVRGGKMRGTGARYQCEAMGNLRGRNVRGAKENWRSRCRRM